MEGIQWPERTERHVARGANALPVHAGMPVHGGTHTWRHSTNRLPRNRLSLNILRGSRIIELVCGLLLLACPSLQTAQGQPPGLRFNDRSAPIRLAPVTSSAARGHSVLHYASIYPLQSEELVIFRLPPLVGPFAPAVVSPQPQRLPWPGTSPPPMQPFSCVGFAGPAHSIPLTARLQPPARPPTEPSELAEQAEAEAARPIGRESEPTTIGPAPVDNRLQFLRQGTVLLSPGQWQFDYGISYALSENELPVITSEDTLAAARLRRRSLLVPFALRLGVTPSIQAFVNAPVGWGQTEFAFSEFDATENVGGIGDVSGGVNFLLEPSHHGSPDIVLTVGFVAPTGDSTFGPSLSGASLGNGFWSVFSDLRFIQSYDPVVVFWGAGYRFQFQRSFSGVEVDPGDEITYQMGVGLAINQRITLSTAFFGSVITESKVNGLGVPKSTLEPMRLRLALTTVTSNKKILEPFVTFGLTPDATNAEVGLIVTLF